MLTPEEQLKNVATCVINSTKIKRDYKSRKGKANVYEGKVDEIAGSAKHLAEMILAYLEGDLKPIDNSSDIPF